MGSAVGAAAVGALLGGLIANRFGRKPTIILAAVFFRLMLINTMQFFNALGDFLFLAS